MIKILNNTTASPIEIADVGISISANSSYTIPSQDYNLFASSDDIVSYIGNGDIVVNDGTIDLSAAQGIGLIQGSFVKKTVNFDSSLIDGQNRLKVILDQVSPNDYLVKVSSDDTTGAYLQDKILQTNNKLSVTVENDGANEKIRLNIGSDVFDKSTNTTDNITEGATNKYYTSERAQDDVSSAIQSGSQDGISFSYNDTSNTYNFTNTDKGSTAVNDHIMDLDPYPQYLLTSGARSMSGSLNMGTNNITNVGTVDGVDISSHASRHLPNGSDPLTTGTPSSISTSNSEGIANAFARQDHVHNHGSQTSQDHHAVATTSTHGFMSSTDKTKLDGIEAGATNYTDEKAQDAVGGILTDTSTVTFSYNDVSNTISANVAASGINHSTLSGLASGDPHTQYLLMSGRSGGQTIYGGTGSSQNLTVSSTSNATKGKIIFGSSVFDEGSGKVGIGTLTPLTENTLVTSSISSLRGFSNINYTNTTDSGKFIACKSRGSELAPTQIQTNDVLGNYSYFGRGSTTFIQGAAIRAVAQQNFTDSAAGTQLEFQIAANNSTIMQTALTIQQDTIVKTNNAIRPGNSTDTTNGNIRFSGTDLEGYVDGSWKSLTQQSTSITYYRNASVAQISTTSTSYTLMSGMSVTPVSGTYIVIARATLTTTSNSRLLNISLFKGGTLVTDSETSTYIRTGSGFLTNSDIGNPSTDAVVTVNGSETVGLRWKTSGGTAQANSYSLILIKVA